MINVLIQTIISFILASLFPKKSGIILTVSGLSVLTLTNIYRYVYTYGYFLINNEIK